MISAVVINWNGRGYLESCLQSLLDQVPPPAEVLLIDNHSDDGSRELVAERFPAVRVIDVGQNAGPAHARNVGVERAAHDRVLLVDNDVVLGAGTLASLAGTFAAAARPGWVQARSVVAEQPDVVHYDGADLHFLGLLTLRNWFVPLRLAVPPAGPVGAGIALCFLTDKTAFRAAGGFFAELFILFEDTELSYRLRALGYTVHLDPHAIVQHRGGTAGISLRGAAAYPARRVYLHSRNRWLVLLSCLRWRTLLLTLPMQLAYGAVQFAFAISKGHLGGWLAGKRDQLGLLRRALARRRALRGRRVVADRELLRAEPLTPNPGIARGGLAYAVRATLDRLCAWHWRLVRWACG